MKLHITLVRYDGENNEYFLGTVAKVRRNWFNLIIIQQIILLHRPQYTIYVVHKYYLYDIKHTPSCPSN